MLAVSQPVSTIFQPQMMRELPLVSLASVRRPNRSELRARDAAKLAIEEPNATF